MAAGAGLSARIGIALVALYDLWWFVDYLPSLSVPSPAGENFYTIQLFVFLYVVTPLCGLTALILAIQGKRLKLAALLAAVPPLYHLLSIVAFGIAVMIYGF